MNNSKNKVKLLLVLWIISYIIVSFLFAYYNFFYGTPINEIAVSGVRNTVGPLTLLIVLIYFIPLMVYINRSAKKCEMKKIVLVSRVIIGLMLIWSAFTGFFFVLFSYARMKV